MRKMTIGLAMAAVVVLGTGSAAFAGEYNGKGEPVPGGVKGKSICSYSGLDVADDLEGEDNIPDDALTGAGEEGARGATQSYGLYVRNGLKDYVPSPGELCRGNTGGEH